MSKSDMKNILVGLMAFPLLTSCGLTTKISDWTGWDLILFLIGLFLFFYFGDLIYKTMEERRLVDQKKEQEEELMREEKRKEHIKKMNEKDLNN